MLRGSDRTRATLEAGKSEKTKGPLSVKTANEVDFRLGEQA
jgi:hypothetical protein